MQFKNSSPSAKKGILMVSLFVMYRVVENQCLIPQFTHMLYVWYLNLSAMHSEVLSFYHNKMRNVFTFSTMAHFWYVDTAIETDFSSRNTICKLEIHAWYNNCYTYRIESFTRCFSKQSVSYFTNLSWAHIY